MPNPAGNFSLEEILAGNPEWERQLSEKVWHNIKSSPTWKGMVDLNGRMESVEARLGKIEGCLQEILGKLNGGFADGFPKV